MGGNMADRRTLRGTAQRYRRTTKKQKAGIPDEFVATHECTRNHAAGCCASGARRCSVIRVIEPVGDAEAACLDPAVAVAAMGDGTRTSYHEVEIAVRSDALQVHTGCSLRGGQPATASHKAPRRSRGVVRRRHGHPKKQESSPQAPFRSNS